ncbi:MAG TPA: S41 family peptidase, partial [Candidatus Limnocylindrales bacterium]|nr:S41 family peptidase [Candidatus Limnocylindrales bacterium]
SWAMVPGRTIALIRLDQFATGATEGIKDAITGAKADGATAIILDLRGNPGGYVTAARDVASQFIGSGVVFYEQDANGVLTPTEAVPGGVATDPSIRVVALVDGGSASASEIVAGALKDTGRATLVGQTTFGKGTVQQWQELAGEGGAFRLTIAKWLTPDKRWIHNIGIEPDITVDVPATVGPGEDPVLARALDVVGAEARPKLGGP